MKKQIVLLTLLGAFNCTYAQIYVDANATGLNNGSSWLNAYTNLQEAINVSVANDEVWVKNGVYLPQNDLNGLPTSNNRLKIFTLKESVKLYGGFNGSETAIIQRDLSNNTTILSGDFGIQNDNSDNAYTVVLALDLSSNSVLDGFNILYGNNNRTNGTITIGSYSVNRNSGGGMLIISSDLQISNCYIDNNYARDDGAGLWIDKSSNPTVVNTSFSNNLCDYYNANGGAVFLLDSGGSFDNCTFSGNNAHDAGAVGIANIILSVNFTNCQFTDNIAIEDGGAVTVFNSTLPANSTITFENCSFDNNKNTLGGSFGVTTGRGGAVFLGTARSIKIR